MPKRARIVPDTSVLVPFFFPDVESDSRSPKRAARLVAAIQSRAVVAFAPEVTFHEFIGVARRLVAAPDRGGGMDAAVVSEQVREFAGLPIEYVPSVRIVDDAWDLVLSLRLSASDAFQVACARLYDAELWVSHRQRDGFVSAAESVHPRVRLLDTHRFEHR